MAPSDRSHAIAQRIIEMLDDFLYLEASWTPISHFDFVEPSKTAYGDIAENLLEFVSHEEQFAYATEQDGYIEKAWGSADAYTTIRDLSQRKTRWMTDLFEADIANKSTGPDADAYFEGLTKGTGFNKLEEARFYTEILEGVMRYKEGVMQTVADYFQTQFNDENLAEAKETDDKDVLDDYLSNPDQLHQEAEDRDRDELDASLDNMLEAHGRTIENLLQSSGTPDDTIHHVLQEVYNDIECEADDHYIETGEAIGMKLMAERLREKAAAYEMNADAFQQIQQSFVTLREGIVSLVSRELSGPSIGKAGEDN